MTYVPPRTSKVKPARGVARPETDQLPVQGVRCYLEPFDRASRLVADGSLELCWRRPGRWGQAENHDQVGDAEDVADILVVHRVASRFQTIEGESDAPIPAQVLTVPRQREEVRSVADIKHELPVLVRNRSSPRPPASLGDGLDLDTGGAGVAGVADGPLDARAEIPEPDLQAGPPDGACDWFGLLPGLDDSSIPAIPANLTTPDGE